MFFTEHVRGDSISSTVEIDSGVKNYWSLKAIDSIEASHNMSQQERSKIVKTIINDEKIGNILEKRIEANK